MDYLKGTNDALPKFTFKGDWLQDLAGGSLHRISLFGLATTAALEAPALINSITKTEGTVGDKAKAFGTQAIKSSAYIGLINGGIAAAGYALGKYGKCASLLGMAIGSTVGLLASKEINKQVDNIFKGEIA